MTAAVSTDLRSNTLRNKVLSNKENEMNEPTHRELAQLLIEARDLTTKIFQTAVELRAPQMALSTIKGAQAKIKDCRVAMENFVAGQGGTEPIYFAKMPDGSPTVRTSDFRK